MTQALSLSKEEVAAILAENQARVIAQAETFVLAYIAATNRI